MRRIFTLSWIALGLALGCTRSQPESTAAGPASASAIQPRVCPERLRIELVQPGASAADIEQQVVASVEMTVARVSGVERVSSTITEGRATVWVELSPGRLDVARLELHEALAGLDSLPEDVERPTLSVASPRPTQVVVSRGPTDEVLTAAVDELERALLATPGITSVQRRGRRASVLSIEPDPARLLALGIDRSSVAEAVREVLDGGGQMFLRGPSMIGIEGVQETQLTAANGSPVRLAELATLRVEPQGPRAWSGEATVELLLVESSDPELVTRTLSQAPIPTSVSHSIAGRLVPRGCFAPPELDGDFDVLELGLPPDRHDRPSAVWTREAPQIEGAVWLVADPLLGNDGSSSASRVQVLLPQGSPQRAELLAWIERTPGFTLRGDYGPERAHLVIELVHPDSSVLEAAATRLIELGGARGLAASSAPPPALGLDIEIRREEAARLGLSTYEISKAVRLASGAETLGFVEDGGRRLPVRLAGGSPPQAILLTTADGAMVPLSAVADMQHVQQAAELGRRDMQRVRHVMVGSAQSALSATQQALDDDVLPALALAYPELRVHHEP